MVVQAPPRDGGSAPAEDLHTAFSGGQTMLEGAAYYRFFIWLMLGTVVVFVSFALAYRQKSYLEWIPLRAASGNRSGIK